MKKLGVCAWGVLLLTLLLASCRLFESRERVVGTFWDGSESPVTVPTEVVRGQPFEVRVRTLGGGCTERGVTAVEMKGLQADITPFNYEVTPAFTPCLLYAQEITHTATLKFDQMGTATITFLGQNPDASSPQKLLSIERTLTVR